jgi:hypothetical protein
MSQIIARLGIGQDNPAIAIEALTVMRNTAIALEQKATGYYIEADVTIYRVGNNYLTVSKGGTILSYVQDAKLGGVAQKYLELGGK